MPSLTEAVQSAIRNLTGASGQWVEDWHALFDQAGIAPGQFGERMVAYAKSVGAPSSDATAALEYFLANPNDTHFIFAGANKLSPLITFSRGTNATLFDSAGTLVYAPSNLVTYSGAFDNAAWTKTNATFTANYVVAPGGGATAGKLIGTAAGASPSLSQAVSLRAGIAHTYSVYAKAAELGFVKLSAEGAANPATAVAVNLATLSVTTVTGSPVSPAATDAGAGWVRVSFSVTATSTASGTLAIYPCSDATGVYTGDGASGLYVHGAQLNTGATLAAYNATTSAAYYGPRLDYNPSTLAARGLLIEEQRTNISTYSADFSNVIWNKVRSSVSADVITSPAGTLTGDKLIEDTTVASNHLIRLDIAVTNATTYTFSLFAKAAERTQIGLQFGTDNGAFAATESYFTLSGAGTATTTLGSPAATIQNVGNGWYRCTVTSTAIATATAALRISIFVSGSAFYTGDGTSGLYIWGAQLEAGAFPTSYIPTTTAAATRNADLATVNTLTPWYNQSAGTICASATTFATSNYGPTVVVQIAGGTNRHQLGSFTNAAATVDSGVVQSSVGSIITATSSVAYAYATNDFAVSVNGGAVGTDTSGSVPTNLSYMTLGKYDFGGAQSLNGWLRRISYYPVRLGNSQLQALTT